MPVGRGGRGSRARARPRIRARTRARCRPAFKKENQAHAGPGCRAPCQQVRPLAQCAFPTKCTGKRML